MSENKLQAVRGMNDVVPSSTPYWQHVEDLCRQLMERYCYREIRFPVVESTSLFKRTIGDVTDIVEKEMYTFEDRNGDSLTLRPEGTAGCVRAAIQQSILHQPVQRLWYMGPMFRHERPQKGRSRQFHQVGVEAFGMEGAEIDAEHIILMHRLWKQLGLQDKVALQINSIGTTDSRARYREVLVQYFNQHKEQLDSDSLRRLATNPLRILDSKNPDMQELIHEAPMITNYLDAAALSHFERLQKLLTAAEIDFEVNPRLVRGLDYYDYTVYEWMTTALGAQGTVCAGGRYNGLVEHLGGKPTPAVGFAMGLERVVLLLEEIKQCKNRVDIFMVLVGDAAAQHGLVFAENLRNACPHLNIETNCAGGSFKAQFKRADRSDAHYAVILGDDEVAKRMVTLKHLREEKPQQTLLETELIQLLQARFAVAV